MSHLLKTTSLLIAAVLCATTALPAVAYSSYQDELPNGRSVPSHPGVGHTNTGGGGVRNAFGQAFAGAGRTWTNGLCTADSDGDGFTNGQELGDPNCVWTKGSTPERTVGISDPSVASSTPDLDATPAPPTTSAPLAAGASVGATTTPFSFLGGKLRVGWTVYDNDVIDVFFASTSSLYAGFGLADQAMNGAIITCFVDSTNGGQCSLWTGSNLAISSRAASMVVVSSALDGTSGGFNITVRTTVSSLGVNRGKKQRAIVAVGAYNSATNSPSQHAGSDRGSTAVDIFAGSSDSDESTKFRTTAIIVIVVVMIVLLVFVAALNFARIVLGPYVNMIGMLFLMAVFVALIAMYTGLAYKDHTESVNDVATARAFGDAALVCLWFVLWPVPKVLNVGRLAGTTFERMMAYHVLVAFVFTIIATLHFIIMMSTLDNATSRVSKWEGDIPPLPGLFAWICLVIIVLVAVFVRRTAYWFHRIIHSMFLLVFIFTFLHYPLAALAMIPPLLVWLVDVIVRFVKALTTKVEVVSAVYDPAGEFTHLVLHVPGLAEPAPAQFALVAVSDGGECGLHTANSHPISVAWFDKPSSEAHFFIKSQGAGTWSGKLGQAATKPNFCPQAKVTWTGAYGALQVPLGKTETALLVAGGVGITPCLHILQQVAKGYNQKAVKHVALLWSVRDTALLTAVRPLMAEALMEAATNGIAARIDVFLTGKGAQPVAEMKGVTVLLRRVDVEHDAAVALDAVAGSSRGAVSTYACGPEALMAAATKFAEQTPGGLLHTETFNL